MPYRDGGRRWRDTFGQNRLGPDPEEAARAAERLQTIIARNSDKEAAISELVQAWTNPGSHPSIHEREKEGLRRTWPILYWAIERVVDHHR